MSNVAIVNILETGKALNRFAKLPSDFWAYAFQTVVYLINQMPTSTLDNISPPYKKKKKKNHV